MLSQGVGAVLMTMRVYALYNQNRRLLCALLLIAMALIAEACWGILSTAPVTLPPTSMPAIGCDDPLSPQQDVRLAGSWSSQLAFDSLIFCLTLWKTWRIGSVGGRPLVTILLRDVNGTRSGFKDDSLPPVTSVFSMEAPLSEIDSYLLSTRYTTRTSGVTGDIGTMDNTPETSRLCRH
ncbi:hypothetical protein SERLA73DRAFT_69274 [Serpula lacrymans var. lacrymans S7.3]|uniref:Uncharacterized protein n=2 Tax=Serpula lacrymans var. lacrymans TaxID=341189 RepID=F8PIN0_SERL3|nr:uncharacterized protein SERLADRAFT_433166 [Serpula lacrymans var. lacrymans S7.9]EGO03401.1 hypothetical protein SERLA73DRAFT_69274 [Serpula lacrymans var. lacrymans S7.3]EGO29169.1 hypothetical protein SERLADRAFT_433166 [Serpula lacrymans var. lacrymans S7.9]